MGQTLDRRSIILFSFYGRKSAGIGFGGAGGMFYGLSEFLYCFFSLLCLLGLSDVSAGIGFGVVGIEGYGVSEVFECGVIVLLV